MNITNGRRTCARLAVQKGLQFVGADRAELPVCQCGENMIIEYGDKAWVLYAGNHKILTDTYVNYNTYYEHLLYCKKEGLKIYDQFGTIGDLSKDNPRIGLHEFKKKFGGDYVEFIGEFDYIINKPMYFVFTKLVPLYRKIIKNKSKKELKHEVNRTK